MIASFAALSLLVAPPPLSVCQGRLHTHVSADISFSSHLPQPLHSDTTLSILTTDLLISFYSAAKVAVRALADTLRFEMLRHDCLFSKYSVHCAFPGDFVSPGFYLEQDTKTPLTKRLQGTSGLSRAELEACYPSSDAVAAGVIAAVQNGVFIICSDSMTASLLFTNMTGPSPKRGWGILDSIVGLLVGWIVWPVLRRKWERLCRIDGEQYRRKED